MGFGFPQCIYALRFNSWLVMGLYGRATPLIDGYL